MPRTYKNSLTAAVMVAHFWVSAQYLDRKQLRKRYNLLKTGQIPKLTLRYNTWHRDSTLPLQLPAWTGNPKPPLLCEAGPGAAVTPGENRTHTTCSPSKLQRCDKFLFERHILLSHMVQSEAKSLHLFLHL